MERPRESLGPARLAELSAAIQIRMVGLKAQRNGQNGPGRKATLRELVEDDPVLRSLRRHRDELKVQTSPESSASEPAPIPKEISLLPPIATHSGMLTASWLASASRPTPDTPKDPDKRRTLEALAAPTAVLAFFSIAACFVGVGPALAWFNGFVRRRGKEAVAPPVRQYQPPEKSLVAKVERGIAPDVVAKQPEGDNGPVAKQVDNGTAPDVQAGPTATAEPILAQEPVMPGSLYKTNGEETVWDLIARARLGTNNDERVAFCRIAGLPEGCSEDFKPKAGLEIYIPTADEIEKEKNNLVGRRAPAEAQTKPAPESEPTFRVLSSDFQVETVSEPEEGERQGGAEKAERAEEAVILPPWLVTDEEEINQWLNHFVDWARAVEKGEKPTLEVIVPVNFIPGLENVEPPEIVEGPLKLEMEFETKGIFGKTKTKTVAFAYDKVYAAAFRGFPLSTPEAEVSLHGDLGGLYTATDSFSGYPAFVFRTSEFSEANLAFIFQYFPRKEVEGKWVGGKWVMSGKEINPNGVLDQPAQLLVVAYKRSKDGLIEKFYPLAVQEE